MPRDHSRSSSHSPTDGGADRLPAGRRRRDARDNLVENAGRRRRSPRDIEREADEIGPRALRGDRTILEGRGRDVPAVLPPHDGHPLRPETRNLAERTLGLDATGIRVHDDRDAQLTASALGARAFADGRDIWLGAGESELDRDLMAHELSHVAQAEPGLYLRSATWLERRAWLGFFDHYLPRKFLNNYMDDTGAPIVLSLTEMMDVNPIVNIRQSQAFAGELRSLQAQVQASAAAGKPSPAVKYINVNGPGQALTNGTLGNFTIRYSGALVVNTDGNWTFSGVMTFYDIWDFDPKPFGSSGRSTAGEIKTRVASFALPGSSFEITSVPAVFAQTGVDRSATWAGGTPKHVGDKAGRTGADIAVGATGGEVVGAPGVDVGGEVGAQSAEDLN
jgi:hypothetical protein